MLGWTTEELRFVRCLKQHGCSADKWTLPTADRAQDKARQRLKRMGFVKFEAGKWHLTADGVAATVSV